MTQARVPVCQFVVIHGIRDSDVVRVFIGFPVSLPAALFPARRRGRAPRGLEAPRWRPYRERRRLSPTARGTRSSARSRPTRSRARRANPPPTRTTPRPSRRRWRRRARGVHVAPGAPRRGVHLAEGPLPAGGGGRAPPGDVPQRRARAPRRRHALRGQRRGRVVHRVDAPRADARFPRARRARLGRRRRVPAHRDRVPPAALAQARDRGQPRVALRRRDARRAAGGGCPPRRVGAGARRARRPQRGGGAVARARGGDGAEARAPLPGKETSETSETKRDAHASKMRAANAALSSRLAPFPEAARASTHRCVAVLPARLAALLSREPQLIAPATQAFYLRDPAGLNAAARAAFFPPRDTAQTLVDDDAVSVRAARPAEVRAVPRVARRRRGAGRLAAAAGRRDARREDHRRVRDPRGGVASARALRPAGARV